jgi:hypothetical protein
MPTLEELLRYKYGDSQTPDDILRRLESINLQNKKNAKAIPTTPAGDRIVPTQEDDSPYGKLERGIFEGLQKYGPSTFQDPYRANQTAGALTDVLSMTPGPAEIMDHRQGNYLMEEGRPVAGLGYQAMAALPFIPANRVRRAIPDNMGGGGPTVTPNVRNAPTPKGLEHKILHTADRPKEIKDVEKWNSDLANLEDSTEVIDVFTGESPYTNRKGLMPLRYGDNDTQMTSQIALFESDLYTVKNKNKVYPIENILQAMRRYGVTGKGNVNQNVARQIEDFISPEFMAKGKASPADVMEELQKNAPKIQEVHAYYNPGVNTGYSRFTTRRPLYDLDNPATTVGDSAEQTSRSYGERTFSMFDDGRIYGKKPTLEEPNPKVSFVDNRHDDLAMGRISVAESTSSGKNKYMHSRYTLEDIDGEANVYVKQESQSDPYELTKDQNKLAASVGAEDELGGRMHVEHILSRIGDEDSGISFEDIAKGKHTAGDALEATGDTRDFHNFLKETGELDNFNKEFDEIAKKFETERQDAIAAGNFEILNRPFEEGRIDDQYYTAEAADAFNQRGERLISNYMQDFSDYLGISKNPINLPRSADWFTDGFKLDLQTAVKNDSPYALFPNGARSLAPPSGVTTTIPPKMVPFIVKKYKDKKNIRLDYDNDGKFLGVSENQDGAFKRVLEAEPDPSSINRAKSYNDFYEKAIKQTQQDYGVKLDSTEYIDQYGQEYLKIILTPELKSAFQTFRMNRGGAATLMPLKYSF